MLKENGHTDGTLRENRKAVSVRILYCLPLTLMFLNFRCQVRLATMLNNYYLLVFHDMESGMRRKRRIGPIGLYCKANFCRYITALND